MSDSDGDWGKYIYSIINLKKEGYNISLTLVGSNQFNTIGKKIKSIFLWI